MTYLPSTSYDVGKCILCMCSISKHNYTCTNKTYFIDFRQWFHMGLIHTHPKKANKKKTNKKNKNVELIGTVDCCAHLMLDVYKEHNSDTW